jgi:hypothetical protein
VPKSPEFSIRLGYVQASVWKREHKGATFYNVTINRSYKTDDDEWKTTDSFSTEDLLTVAKLADECATLIIRKQLRDAQLNRSKSTPSKAAQSTEADDVPF